jgi:TatD DNase family protein
MLIDTHCHIHDPQYNFDPKATLVRAHAAGVDKIIVIGTSPADNKIARTFAEAHSEVYWAYGAHPHEGTEVDFLSTFFESISPVRSKTYIPDATDGFASLEAVPSARQCMTFLTESGRSKNVLGKSKLVAIGEIGLDYHYQPFDRDAQIKLFERMLDLAQKQNLPIIFHVREAFDDFWPIVDNAGVKNAVLHSFSDNEANLQAAIKRNFYIGVNGIVTFANIPLPPLEYMLLETDAPYLTPRPFRGKINEPSYVKHIAEWVADKLKVSPVVVADQTTTSATQLFNL